MIFGVSNRVLLHESNLFFILFFKHFKLGIVGEIFRVNRVFANGSPFH